jgi:hypothetical protein
MGIVKRNRNITQEFAQMPDLCIIFSVSSKFFTERVKLGLLKRNVHFFPQKIQEDAKRSVVLWDIEAVRQFVKSHPSAIGDNELEELLNR